MSGVTYDFDEIIDRHETGSVKWDALGEHFGADDLLPLWVADMDFRSPPQVIDALTLRAQHGVYGYSSIMPSYYDSVISWYRRRYHWELKKDWIVFSPGVVPALNYAIQALTIPGDRVIVQPPVYYPFYWAVESNGRHALYNPLKFSNGRYEMDFQDLEEKVKDPRAKAIILCSPHNPVGRVWKMEELKKLGQICVDNGILVISDEIHSDLRYPGIEFTNFASISEEFAHNSITCTSGTKTFNLAGIQISNIIIPNKRIRQAFESSASSAGSHMPNSFAPIALQTAYNEGEDWLDQLLEYLLGNLQFLKEFIRENIPSVQVVEPEGTYLCWLDFRKVESDPAKLEGLMRKDAKVALDEGYIFRTGGDGFERINLACPRAMLKQALMRIADAVQRYLTKK